MSDTEPTGVVAASAKDSRWAALYVMCVGMLMIVLDVTVVNVALPSIQTDLHFTTSSLAWVVNAYLIAFGGLLLLAGRYTLLEQAPLDDLWDMPTWDIRDVLEARSRYGTGE